MSLPTCDGWCFQEGTVTMIDTAGFVYCTPCGARRRQSEPCRKMRPHEVRRVERGLPVERY